MSIKIRKIKKGEERKVSNLCKKCIEEINSKELTKKQTELLIHEFSIRGIERYSKRASLFIARRGDKIVGTVTLFNNQIKGMFVHPDYLKLGYGTQLLEHAEKIAMKNGYTFSFLNASHFAVKFYRKNGYRKVKTIDSIVGRMTMMRKNIVLHEVSDKSPE